jgi:oxygen-dependent protoporphyrinogen oxidase
MIAVVGGGITGLAAAHEIVRSAPDRDVVVLEADDRLGGKILTSAMAGRPVDAGADAFLARHPAGIGLCRELGIGDRLISPAERRAYVYADGSLRELPTATLLGVPTDLDGLRRSGLVSAAGIERAARDLTGPTAVLADGRDASVGEVVRQGLGDEVLERLVDPLIGGINAGDSDRLSVRACTPQIAEAAGHPSLISGARAVLAATTADPDAPVFFGLPGGMQALVDALVAELAAAGVDLRTGTAVTELAPAPRGGWTLSSGDDRLDVDAVVLTVPASAAAALLADVIPDAARLLAEVEYASVVLVTLAVPSDGLRRSLDASGFLVPRTEGLLLTACSWASTKWDHLAGDPVLLRASAGRAGDARTLDLDDADLLARLLADLERTMGLAAEPVEVRVTRWPRSFPQYAVGHLDRVGAIESAVAAHARGVVVAGAAYRGLGLPACIDQGRRAARTVLDR